ncbi:hypothetical protein EV363DRAFT_1297622 [Boletus edulis]|nr:hypothetical protein EV363DRAFT_1297622 [Boletus edulis]
MFIHPSTILFSVIALVGVATAVPTALEARTSSTCNSGSVNCCQSVQSSSSSVIIELFGFLGLPMPAGNTQIGLTCSPVTLGGTSTGSICTQQTVCCTGNTFWTAICRFMYGTIRWGERAICHAPPWKSVFPTPRVSTRKYNVRGGAQRSALSLGMLLGWKCEEALVICNVPSLYVVNFVVTQSVMPPCLDQLQDAEPYLGSHQDIRTAMNEGVLAQHRNVVQVMKPKLQFPHRKTPALSHRTDTNMFIRPSTILFSAIALAGVATALPSDLEVRNGGSNTCNSGSIIELFGYLGIPLPGGNTQIGLTCSPVTLGGSSTGSICTQQTVCCTGNSFTRMLVQYGVSTACSPININL